MALGGWNGAAEGLKTGMALGNQFNEISMKRDALHQDLVKEKLGLYGKRLEADIGTLKSMISEMPDKNDPKQADAIKQYSDQLKQTASIIGTLNPQLGSQYKQLIDVTVTQTKDKATQFTEAQTNKRNELEGNARAFADASVSGMGGTTPTAGTPTPSGPSAPPPGPAMEAPNQQVAMEPQAGLTSQAAAEPAMPMPDMTSQSATAPAPAAPQAMPAAAPQQMAGSPTGSQDAKEKAYQLYMKRAFEKENPPTAIESKINDMDVKQFGELRDKADKAIGLHKSISEARQLVSEGIFTGFGAEVKLSAAKAAGGSNKTLADKVRRTERFRSIMGRMLGEQLKAFGSATAISNLDLTTVQQYIGQDISMNEDSIQEVLHAGEVAAEEAVGLYNQYAERLGQPARDVLKSEGTGKDPNVVRGGGQSNFAPDKDGWINVDGRTRFKHLGPAQ